MRFLFGQAETPQASENHNEIAFNRHDEVYPSNATQAPAMGGKTPPRQVLTGKSRRGYPYESDFMAFGMISVSQRRITDDGDIP
jgi:hypothetical protein